MAKEIIQETVFESGSLANIKLWLGAALVQVAIAEVLSLFCGWLPDMKFSNYLATTVWEPYAPCYSGAALLLGFYISPVVMKGKGARSTWLIGVLWIAYGFFDSARTWVPGWPNEPSRWVYAAANLFGTMEQCGESKCMSELIFTAPGAIAIAYSAGALAYKLWRRVAGARSASRTA